MAEYIDRDELLKELYTVSAPTPSESWIVEKCIEKVNEQPTADVVPKSEVDWNIIPVDVSEALKQRAVEKAKADVAREIFAEIENRAYGFGACFVEMTRTTFDEIKKKYTEGEPNGSK